MSDTIVVQNIAIAVPKCEYAAIANMDLVDKTQVYDVNVGTPFTETVPAATAYIKPDHCGWSWDGVMEIYDDADLTT